MNPGPRGPQPDFTGSLRKVTKRKVIHDGGVCVEITKGLIEEFVDWVKSQRPGISKGQLTRYNNYMIRLMGFKLCGKSDVTKAFELMGGLNKATHNTFSRFLTFLEKTRELDELVAKLRKAMPSRPKTGEDSYVPPDSKVLEIGERLAGLGEPYTLVYNVLVATGCRCREAIYLINNIRRLRVVDLGEFVRVHVDLQRGAKNEFVMYLPKEVYQQVLRWRGKLPHEDTIQKAFREAGLASKYFRKWWRQTAKKLGIDSEDIEAFQGRVSSVGGRHYTDWIPILDKDYERILPRVREFIIT